MLPYQAAQCLFKLEWKVPVYDSAWSMHFHWSPVQAQTSISSDVILTLPTWFYNNMNIGHQRLLKLVLKIEKLRLKLEYLTMSYFSSNAISMHCDWFLFFHISETQSGQGWQFCHHLNKPRGNQQRWYLAYVSIIILYMFYTTQMTCCIWDVDQSMLYLRL